MYKIKRNADDSIERCKVRLVAQGFSQFKGIDYTYSYCPLVKPTMVKCVLTLAASRGWVLQQIEVRFVFLNGDINEVVLMCQPSSFEDKQHP